MGAVGGVEDDAAVSCPVWCERDHDGVHYEDLVHHSRAHFVQGASGDWSDGAILARSLAFVMHLERPVGTTETWVNLAEEEGPWQVRLDVATASKLLVALRQVLNLL